MNQQNRSEQLRTESEARHSASGSSTSSWDRVQAALRRYLTTEGYRASHEQGQGETSSTRRDAGDGRSPR